MAKTKNIFFSKMLKNSTNILNFKLCTIEKVLVSVFWTGDHEVGHVLGF